MIQIIRSHFCGNSAYVFSQSILNEDKVELLMPSQPIWVMSGWSV